MTVTKLLTASFHDHQEARALRRLGSRRDVPAVWAALTRAYRLRQEAHEADPDHTDPAWRVEQAHTTSTLDTHQVLMAFYEQQLLLNA